MPTLTNGRYVPAGAVKVADKRSDAVAYVYTNGRGQPCAIAFQGKSAKPVWCFHFRDDAARETRVRKLFADRQACVAWKDERKAQRKAKLAKPHSLQVGHILRSMWGYEQTNIDYYQVTAVLSGRMVEIRKIGGVHVDTTGWASGTSVPNPDHFIGEPMRKRVNEYGSVKITSYADASLWEGRPDNWTAYA